jgi:hypothetical protein
MDQDELIEKFRAVFGATASARRARNELPDVTLMDVREQGIDTHGVLRVRRDWVEEERRITVRIPGFVIQLQLTLVMHDGARLRAKGKSPAGGDLYMRLQFSE